MCTLQFVVISRFELCFVALRQRQHRRPICHLCNVHITKHNNRYADFLSLSLSPAIVAVHDQISGHANYLSVYIPVSLGGMLTTLSGRIRFLRRFCLPLVKDADCRVLLAGPPNIFPAPPPPSPLFTSPDWPSQSQSSSAVSARLYETNLCHTKATSENTAIDAVSQELRAQHASHRAALEITSKEPDPTIGAAAGRLAVTELIKVAGGQSRNHEASR